MKMLNGLRKVARGLWMTASNDTFYFQESCFLCWEVRVKCYLLRAD